MPRSLTPARGQRTLRGDRRGPSREIAEIEAKVEALVALRGTADYLAGWVDVETRIIAAMDQAERSHRMGCVTLHRLMVALVRVRDEQFDHRAHLLDDVVPEVCACIAASERALGYAA